MDFKEIITYLAVAFLAVGAVNLIFKEMKQKSFEMNGKFIAMNLIAWLTMGFNSFNQNIPLKLAILFSCFFIIALYYNNFKFVKSLLNGLFIFALYFIADMLFGVFVVFVLKMTIEEMKNNYAIYIGGSAVGAVLPYLMYKLIPFKKVKKSEAMKEVSSN